MRYVAGIDIGTTGAKTIIFDEEGTPLEGSYCEYECLYPHPLWVEQSPDELLNAAISTLRDAFQKSGLDKNDLYAISFSTQRSCVIFLDEAGKPLCNMISWQDGRTANEVREIENVISAERFYDVTGLLLGTTWVLPKILWVRKKQAELWEKTRRIVQLHDYIAKSFGAEEYVVPKTDCGLSGLWNVFSGEYEKDFAEKFEIDASMLSNVSNVGVCMGSISKEIAQKTGLSEKTLLCSGAGDQSAAAVGAGIVDEGKLSVSMGTGGMMIACMNQPRKDPNKAFLVTDHAMQNKWEWEGLQKGSAGIYRWFRDEIAGEEASLAKAQGKDVYDILGELAAKVPAGAKGLLVLPFFAASATPRWNMEARGVILGLTFAHDRACLARAFMEGITMEFKDMLHYIKQSGIHPSDITVMGGPTKSSLWNSIQASMYGVPVHTLKVPDASVLGAAAFAAVGAGIYKDIAEAVQAMVKPDKSYEPNGEWEKIYNDQYEAYVASYDGLESKAFQLIAKQQEGC